MSKIETNTIDTISGSATMQVGSTNTSTINIGVSGDTVNIPAGVTIANAGTATGFGATLANGVDNRVVTASSASALNGEQKLTFDGTQLSNTAENGGYNTVLHNDNGAAKGLQVKIKSNDTATNEALDVTTWDSGSTYTSKFSIVRNGYVKAIGVYNQSAGDSANVVIDGSGNLYRSTSALKYKQDVRDLESIDISSFRPVRYKSKSPKDDPNKDFLGFIADEFHDAGLTELVSYGKNDDEGNPVVEGFNYDRLTVILTKALQEANSKIATLEAKVAALESA
tara:strand:- start:344 stop:1189 length:846 start_codon:yes stop_codon:yes gene_type:complete